MKILYDESGNVAFELEDGREFRLADLLADLERLEKIDGAMALVTNSREWNRKRVLELEDELERYQRAHVCTSSCKENAHVAFTGKALVQGLENQVAAQVAAKNFALTQLEKVRQRRDQERQRADRAEVLLAESRELVAFKTRVADEMDRDKDELWAKLKKERELVQEERTRANNLTRRLAEMEARNSSLIDGANLTERTVAASLAEKRQSIEARDRLLAAATTRVRTAAEILSQKRVAEAADEIVTTKGAILADAIRNALAALSA